MSVEVPIQGTVEAAETSVSAAAYASDQSSISVTTGEDSVSNRLLSSMEGLLSTDPEGTKPTHPTQVMPRACEASVVPFVGPGDRHAMRPLGLALQTASSGETAIHPSDSNTSMSTSNSKKVPQDRVMLKASLPTDDIPHTPSTDSAPLLRPSSPPSLLDTRTISELQASSGPPPPSSKAAGKLPLSALPPTRRLHHLFLLRRARRQRNTRVVSHARCCTSSQAAQTASMASQP